ncbi:hypothetical protein DGo_PC0261 (plasmid) [Deinococcus gobiensis I-0]|uniref:Uncharacterized protein n=2 Tax=Deinococcus TaxID=1298 RepID=H8H3F6_DEIGI|nr:hypothetical protein DGo_PC0261 [Deinococcus gobiensis I-0]
MPSLFSANDFRHVP